MSETIIGYNEFDYSQLDNETAEFLKVKETNIKTIANELATQAGKELYEAQQRLSNNRNGVFQNWCNHIGIKYDKANKLIHRYSFILDNFKDKSLLEELPISLTYEAGSSSAPEVLKQGVLDGDVTTHKEYQQLKMLLENEKENAETTIQELKDKLKELANENGKTDANKLTINEMQTKLKEKEEQIRLKEILINNLIAKTEELDGKSQPTIDDVIESEAYKKVIKELEDKQAKINNLYEEIYKQKEESANKKNLIEEKSEALATLNKSIADAQEMLDGYDETLKSTKTLVHNLRLAKEYFQQNIISVTLVNNLSDKETLKNELITFIPIIEIWVSEAKNMFKIK